MRTSRGLAAYRAARAVDLMTEGMDFDDIAVELGYADRSGAWRAAQRALNARMHASVDRYRAVSVAEAEMVVERNWAAAMAGDPVASLVVLKAMDLRLKAVGV